MGASTLSAAAMLLIPLGVGDVTELSGRPPMAGGGGHSERPAKCLPASADGAAMEPLWSGLPRDRRSRLLLRLLLVHLRTTIVATSAEMRGSLTPGYEGVRETKGDPYPSTRSRAGGSRGRLASRWMPNPHAVVALMCCSRSCALLDRWSVCAGMVSADEPGGLCPFGRRLRPAVERR